jgi:hypothetical protein
MTTHYNEKGKFFTDIVAKDEIPVILQTETHRIEGNLHVRLDDRLKDELDREEPFLAITDAIIYGQDGSKLYEVSFLAVNRANIIWIFKTTELNQK